MSKYSFERMLPDDFESMVQALLEKTYRIGGNLIQFGPGPDGGREATWTQAPDHPAHVRPSKKRKRVPKEWVFQVKYHDIGQRGWTNAREAIVDDLEKELDKIVNKYHVPCHVYVMITNVPFTGVWNVGTRDQITAVARKWKKHVAEIFVWDAADLSRMLDANEDVRTAYMDTILPGDILKALYKGATFRQDRVTSAYRAYLQFVTEREGAARAEEAGDEPGLPLAEVFIDLTCTPDEGTRSVLQNSKPVLMDHSELTTQQAAPLFPPKDFNNTPASFALLFAEGPSMLLLGGPGLGKSTLTQFVALYHAARVVDAPLAQRLAERLKLPQGISAHSLDSYCRLRFPFRIELRRYARWMSDEQSQQKPGELARYIAEILVNLNTSSALTMDDVFALAATDPLLLILDGLDEVPNPDTRNQILEQVQIFLRRVRAEEGDVQLLLSSRPKGYFGEFNVFEPYTWELNELEPSDFDDYCNRWLAHRIRDAEERREARDRIDRGMQSEAVQRLARSLLQATVMLSIVRRKSEIPHQRHTLYAKYVDVIFDREKEKSPIVRERSPELLRLHERVGYELHRTMEHTKVEALDRDTFRSYVLSVLQDYSGVDLGQKTLREVADEIVMAATDRLCLLVGKGKEQTDIDFVVQSFREYFAGAYLFNDPEAAPDSVFTTLVRRGAYWANVLQFYVAQANANQQMRWVTSADGSTSHVDVVDKLVDLVRTRRALLGILPEFTIQRNQDFERTLKILFAEDTRWTWRRQQAAVEVLRVIRSRAARKILWDMFGLPPHSDLSTLAVELWLLAGLTETASEEHTKLLDMVQSRLSQEDTRVIAWEIAVQYGLSVNLSNIDLAPFLTSDDSVSPEIPYALFIS